jgi:hypothetical protein
MGLGPDMSGLLEYRGIQFSVEPAGNRRWRWRVSPPACVLGLRPKPGKSPVAETRLFRRRTPPLQVRVLLTAG